MWSISHLFAPDVTEHILNWRGAGCHRWSAEPGKVEDSTVTIRMTFPHINHLGKYINYDLSVFITILPWSSLSTYINYHWKLVINHDCHVKTWIWSSRIKDFHEFATWILRWASFVPSSVVTSLGECSRGIARNWHERQSSETNWELGQHADRTR